MTPQLDTVARSLISEPPLTSPFLRPAAVAEALPWCWTPPPPLQPGCGEDPAALHPSPPLAFHWTQESLGGRGVNDEFVCCPPPSPLVNDGLGGQMRAMGSRMRRRRRHTRKEPFNQKSGKVASGNGRRQ